MLHLLALPLQVVRESAPPGLAQHFSSERLLSHIRLTALAFTFVVVQLARKGRNGASSSIRIN
jgi:hypothetical protein